MKNNPTDTLFLKNTKWILSNTHQTKVVDEWVNPISATSTHFNRFNSHFTGTKTYQLFHDKKDPKHTARVLHDPSKGELLDYNRKGYGIFLTVNETNGKGRTKKDITRVRAVFADLDSAPVNMAPVMDYNPHMVVQSSPGKFHAYWFVYDCPVSTFTEVQKSIIETFGADKACKDESRVLRVPGFYHQKNEPQPTVVVHEHDYPEISGEDIISIFPPVKRKKFSAKRYKRSSVTGKFNGPWGTSEGDRNNQLAKVIGIMIKEQMPWGDIEADAHKWGNSCSPPMRGSEIDHTLRSMMRYAK